MPSASALASLDPAPGPAATKSVFFETLEADLAAGGDDRLLRALPGEALEAAGGDDGQPGEHTAGGRSGAGTRVARRAELHAGSAPLLHDVAVPVDARTSREPSRR